MTTRRNSFERKQYVLTIMCFFWLATLKIHRDTHTARGVFIFTCLQIIKIHLYNQKERVNGERMHFGHDEDEHCVKRGWGEICLFLCVFEIVWAEAAIHTLSMYEFHSLGTHGRLN